VTTVLRARTGARRHARVLLAATAILVSLGLNISPGDSATRSDLARGFHFTELALPEPPGGMSAKTIREVNPSVRRIEAWISAVGAAIALGDLDGNGRDDDSCVVDPRYDTATVAPVPGTGDRYPARVLSPAPLRYDASSMAPMGCLPGDFDEDGRTDLLVYYWGRTPVAFLRSASHGYRRRELVPGGGIWNTNAATQADVDGDGHADLVIGNYFADGDAVLDARSDIPVAMQRSMSRATNGGTDRVLLWTPGGRFREARRALSREVADGWTLAVGAQDLNGDLLPELYLANDYGHDRLLLNRSRPGRVELSLAEGSAGFADASSKVLGRDSFKGMGIDFGDLNRDARPDMVVSNISEEFALMESNFAWLSDGDPRAMEGGHAPYTDQSEELGLARSGWGWDARLDDFDNDGSLEVIQALGFVRGTTNRWPELQELAIANDELLSDADHWPRFGPGTDLSGDGAGAFYARSGDGRFHDIAGSIGFGRDQVSRGIATADVNTDGRLDFAVANQWQRSYLYLNRCPRPCGRSLELRLVRPGATGRPVPAIGAQATVHRRSGRPLVRQVDGGNGHSGKRSPALHFGLGRNRHPVRVELRWRDAGGEVRSRSLTLAPGRHTVVLGNAGDRAP
jgi:hypothetical protein